jgi:hypothetical protein
VLKVKGRRSEDIARLLGYKVADEIVHRDNFVLLEELAGADASMKHWANRV